MAYMSQEKKAEIAAALKLVMPKGWKYSLAVRHHSTLVLNITAAPVDLLDQVKAASADRANRFGHDDYLRNATHLDVNPYHWRDLFTDPQTLATFELIFAALNDGNFDKSDSSTDYFHVGWYVDVNLGRFDRPFVNTAAEPMQVAA